VYGVVRRILVEAMVGMRIHAERRVGRHYHRARHGRSATRRRGRCYRALADSPRRTRAHAPWMDDARESGSRIAPPAPAQKRVQSSGSRRSPVTTVDGVPETVERAALGGSTNARMRAVRAVRAERCAIGQPVGETRVQQRLPRASPADIRHQHRPDRASPGTQATLHERERVAPCDAPSSDPCGLTPGGPQSSDAAPRADPHAVHAADESVAQARRFAPSGSSRSVHRHGAGAIARHATRQAIEIGPARRAAPRRGCSDRAHGRPAARQQAALRAAAIRLPAPRGRRSLSA
jgi:hypothetical protein